MSVAKKLGYGFDYCFDVLLPEVQYVRLFGGVCLLNYFLLFRL